MPRGWSKIHHITLHKTGVVFWRPPGRTTGIILGSLAFEPHDVFAPWLEAHDFLLRCSRPLYEKLTAGWGNVVLWNQKRENCIKREGCTG